MATRKKKDEEKTNGARLSIDLIVEVTNWSPNIVKCKTNGRAFFHTFDLKATMDINQLHAAFEAFGIENTTFMENLPLAVDAVDLPGLMFFDHNCKFKVSEQVVAEADKFKLEKFACARKSETVYELAFKLKGKPDKADHADLEVVALDGADECSFMLAINPPEQEEIPTGTDEQEEGEDEQ